MHSPRTVTYALDVLTGIVNREQVYKPSSDREISLMVILSSCQDARMSSILLSLRAEGNMKMLISFSSYPINAMIKLKQHFCIDV